MATFDRTAGSPLAYKLAIYVILILVAAAFLLPLFVMVVTALKPMDEIRSGSIFSLPVQPSLDHFGKAWFSACSGLSCSGLSEGFWNSIKIVVPATALSVLAGAVTGYALAMWPFRGAKAVMTALMIVAFIPYQVILYPIVRIFSTVGLYNSLPGIILIHIIFGLPVMTMIFKNYYIGLPQELIKAARIDGAGFTRIFVSIILPMSPGILAVTTMMQFTAIWNDYLLGLIFAGRDNLPMTVQLNNIVHVSMGEIEYNVNMAATLLTALPPLLLYLLSGRYFVQGITAGAVKG
ncbi:carbohydrate ABC transporter permease [Rhizobium sp. CG5]|uniref:carbohydrate ABC transporter permease n=1 Tax=Rhizobium sp. CG5 TaxID=2726076 RepID=UPI002034698F|nr:carbohydrate ABC transporter permease [Rhizobium sp. CG5]MCM2477216.1 carbohydrate ABC transporter permease [Rhizobium sp. CG5]